MIWNEKRENAYCEITPALLALKEQWEKKNYIDPRLYKEYNVKRGLRDEDGRGVLTGLTRVGEIQSYQVTSGPDGEHIIPDEGMLYYRGIDCREIVKGSAERGRFAFEEAAYLLLFGELPTADQLQDFCVQLASYRTLPTNFFRDVIMKAPPKDLMNTMQRAILTLFCYDDKPNDVGLENVLRQCLQLVLHADHGGGNNSTFTNHVVTSSGTDTYSAIAASMASLKGPRHGGANSKVMDMMDDIKTHVRDWGSEGEITQYLTKLLDKEAFDRSGLIYGLGHAVYTRSDPRCEVFRDYVHRLAGEKGLEQELALYSNVERIGKQLLMERRHKDAISTNIDFYSGFVYEMLGLPGELYTPLFAVARISGWSAHRMEELSSGGKLIRPRYECVEEVRSYIPMENR